MKKIISFFSMLIVLMCGFSFAEVIDTDKTIKVNKYITDSIDSKDEADCFYFDLSRQGSIQIEFEFDVKGKYYVRVYDLNIGKEIQYREFYTDYNTTSGEETFFADKLRVKAGDYGVKVTSNTEATFDENYRLKVNYVQESKGNYEVEENNTAKDSMEIETNETITGNLQWNRDEDYYMVDVPYDGKLQLNFEFNYNGAYNVVLYQQAGTKLEEIQFNVASTGIKPYYGEYFSQSFDKLRVPAGTYYVKVNSKNYSNEDYNLTVLYNIERYGNFERENNNDIKNPTELYNNTECIGNLNSNKDWDCYVAYITKGELDIELNIPENAIYRIEIWKERSNGDDIEFVNKKDLKKDDNKFGKIQIEESKRYYIGVHCVQYSNEDYTIKLMNNVYTPVYYPVGQTQIDLQIGNQYMNVNGVARLIDNNGTMPVLSNGRTMLPIRAVIEALGGTIEWDNNTFTTTVTIGNKNIKIKIGDKVAYVNGAAKTLDVPSQLINQRTMLPLRFIMENLGGNVTWEDATQIVRIKY